MGALFTRVLESLFERKSLEGRYEVVNRLARYIKMYDDTGRSLRPTIEMLRSILLPRIPSEAVGNMLIG